MSEQVDNNGYTTSDFKRNSFDNMNQQNADDDQFQDGDKAVNVNEKAGEYMRELLSEKIKLNNAKFPYTIKLIDQEVTKVQSTGRIPPKDNKYVDVYREKPVKVTVKVLVPIKEHPKFNFVGKLLGPKGNTMKQLQEETMCKMAVLGRGSMRDRQKEEELRNSLDPKYAHLSDELHVEVSALAPPAEAHARIAYALAEVKKYLLPDQEMGMPPPPPQMRGDHMERGYGPPGQRGPGGPPRGPPPPRTAPPRPPTRMPPGPPRSMPPKAKVMNILDRARSAMEPSYGYDDYSTPEPPQQMRGPRTAETYDYYGYDEYDQYSAPKEQHEPREYKASARDVGTRRPQRGHPRQGYRTEPYQRGAPK